MQLNSLLSPTRRRCLFESSAAIFHSSLQYACEGKILTLGGIMKSRASISTLGPSVH
ncbi:hypothetical protein IGI04_002072 [Brassica rapa subsp. trilocularis]|uniref:Uncharacterized protein n=1 Tax=Brassica rapa subsp. trilocularis TaxID=1813537 RepID=A0ABQ7NWP7_BRACM|nr:hypothetical protein IGI04_002072 [Brassica rapa subsp. trilocularis]